MVQNKIDELLAACI